MQFYFMEYVGNLIYKCQFNNTGANFSLLNIYIFVHPFTEWEGQVFGVGSKIFTIAGPVILYGIVTSWVLGLIYWALKILGVI